jgi:uncharacterized membrane protein
VFGYFLWFLLLFLSSFIPLCSDKIQKIIIIFLYLVIFVLCTEMLSVLEKVPWAAEKNVCSVAAGWNILYMILHLIDK